MGNNGQVAEMNELIGQDYADQDNFSEALKYFNLALKMYEDEGDMKKVAGCYLRFAFVYGMLGNNAEAVNANYHALKSMNRSTINMPLPLLLQTWPMIM